MVVMVLEKVPAALKGELTRWLLEVQSGVYIGHVTAMVRDRLWDKCRASRGAGSVLQAWSTNNEQKFALRIEGNPVRQVVDWEGLMLIQESGEDLPRAQKRRIRAEK